MRYCVSSEKYPLEYVSSGNLISEDHFIHPRRTLDTFVFILVKDGFLHITQDKSTYDVGENEYIFLFPGLLHYGYKPSDGKLSYDWVHFKISDPDCSMLSRASLTQKIRLLGEGLSPDTSSPQWFLMPEYGQIFPGNRIPLLFAQLLDISRRNRYLATWRCHYALNLLLAELSAEILVTDHLFSDRIPPNMVNIIEWIRSHYYRQLSVAEIAEKFGYHPAYLTSLFKKYTGYPVLTFLNRTRIDVSKNLLTASDSSIRTIADMCGFPDEKYYLKLFKKYEGMTPTQYRKAFAQKKIN